MGGNSPYAKGRIYTMGAIIIEIQYKKERCIFFCFLTNNPTQVEERRASEGSILDAARTGEKVAR